MVDALGSGSIRHSSRKVEKRIDWFSEAYWRENGETYQNNSVKTLW
jgi:hypothetical protein